MSGRSRVLMADGRWLLELGEPVPELAAPPDPEPIAQFRMRSKGHVVMRQLDLRKISQRAIRNKRRA